MKRVQRSLSDQPAESSGQVTDQRRGEEFGDDAGRNARRPWVDAGLRLLLRDGGRQGGEPPMVRRGLAACRITALWKTTGRSY